MWTNRGEELTSPALEAVAVCASYPQKAPKGSFSPPVLDGVDLTVAEGELVALLGANGAGKSTLLRVLSGTLEPTSGQVRLFGTPLGAHDRRALARTMAVVGQTEEMSFGFRVRDVVMMGRAPHQGGWMRATDEDVSIVEEAIQSCDLAAFADRPVLALSGGEQKRVAIARALAQRPRVLLLDEPAAFFDVRHKIALYDLLVEQVARQKLACVVVMHDINIASQYASRVALMKAGRFLAVGKVDEVMTYARLRETFDTDLYVGVNELTGMRFFLPMRGR
ncbi:ABC transporter ATP-binding protein [Pendulispora brunnea]|uniref:ABC transporter ATP-binding protein n=1 Tax=Pendulispora brunnea TaxID=2905690 RepID=A0ABZ2K9B2_9BACT